MMKPETMEKLIDKAGLAMLGSVDAEGFPNVKAMLLPRKREGLRCFYFSTNTSSMRVAQFRERPQACIYFCDRRFFRGVMLVGNVEVLTDPQIKKMLWQMGDTLYYPKGVTDPDYCALRFTAQRGRWYSNLQSGSFDVGSTESLEPPPQNSL